jgi:glycine cleavage system aminomethyltransferase T
MAVGTPFHSRTEPLCTSLRWKQWSGYFVAVVYDDFHDPEYHAIRTGAGLIDVSPLYKYDIQGPTRSGWSIA